MKKKRTKECGSELFDLLFYLLHFLYTSDSDSHIIFQPYLHSYNFFQSTCGQNKKLSLIFNFTKSFSQLFVLRKLVRSRDVCLVKLYSDWESESSSSGMYNNKLLKNTDTNIKKNQNPLETEWKRLINKYIKKYCVRSSGVTIL